MGNTPGNPSPAQDWDALSRQYWSAWQELTRQNLGRIPAEAASTPWHEGLEQWARLFGGGSAQNETLERLLASARDYTALMQAMIAAAGGKQADGNAAAWTDALRKGLNLPGIDPALSNNPMAKALREISGQGAKGFEEMMAGFEPLFAQFQKGTDALLDLPSFGYGREHQERIQQAVKAWGEYRQQLDRYNALILKASQRGFERFQDKLAEREEPGRQIESVRVLYDLWVDAAEEAYAEIALSDEFRTVYGALVNAQMRVRSHVQAEVERIGKDLGMPTRSEINSLGERLQEVRRVLKTGAGGVDAALADEVAALRHELEALKAQVAAATAKPITTVRKSATAKPSPSRKR